MPHFAEIKGTTIKTRLEFIEERFGPNGRDEATESVRREFGAEAIEVLLPMSWYPLALDDFLCRFAVRKYQRPEEQVYRDLGVYSAQKHFKYFQSLMAGRKDPMSFLELMPRFHNTYDRGLGEMDIDKPSEKEGVLRIKAPTEPYRSHCATTVAYLVETCLRVTGTSIRGDETACKARGDADCRWRFRW